MKKQVNNINNIYDDITIKKPIKTTKFTQGKAAKGDH